MIRYREISSFQFAPIFRVFISGTTIRLDNIRGGNTPKYLFAGVIPTKNLQGDWEKAPLLLSNIMSVNSTLL